MRRAPEFRRAFITPGGGRGRRNVLVGAQGTKSVKLADFGMSRALEPENFYSINVRPLVPSELSFRPRLTLSVTPQVRDDLVPLKWMAPESVCDARFSAKSDVWSFGAATGGGFGGLAVACAGRTFYVDAVYYFSPQACSCGRWARWGPRRMAGGRR